MNNEQAALIAAAIIVTSYADGGTPQEVEQVASRFTGWLERQL